MKFISKYVGMRTFKTAFAVALCILVSHIMGTNYPIFACIASICAMNPTVKGIFSTVKEQLIGTTFGVALATLCTILLPDTIYIRVPMFFIGIIFVIVFCNQLHIQHSIQLACIVFADVCLFGGSSTNAIYGLNRLFDTTWGLAVAVFVNLTLKPYNNRPRVMSILQNTLDLFPKLLESRTIEGSYPDLHMLRKNLNQLDIELNTYERQTISNRKEHKKDAMYLRGCQQLITKMSDELISLCNMDYPGSPNEINIGRLKEYGLQIPENLENSIYCIDDNNIVFNFHLTNVLDANYFLIELLK